MMEHSEYSQVGRHFIYLGLVVLYNYHHNMNK
jgi:hypothetical protein